ncbi:unnamed protein product [Jaminaea pallidilutea]
MATEGGEPPSEVSANPQAQESNGSRQDTSTEQAGKAVGEQSDKVVTDQTDAANANDEVSKEPDAEPFYPSYDDLGESSLQAIAAAEIAAGLGDFNMEVDEVDEGDTANSTSDATGKRGTKRPHGSLEDDHGNATEANSASDLLDQFTTTTTGRSEQRDSNKNPAEQPSGSAPVRFQQAFGSSSTQPPSTQNALQKTAQAGATTAAASTAPAAPATTTKPPVTTAPQSGAPAMPRPPAPRPAPSTLPSVARPAPIPRPPQRPVSLGGRPVPPRPGLPNHARPHMARPMRPGPALPAAALFSATPPPGAPSFAALLSALGPQDLAMVAHAAMGLDANGNPLPGNEESHKALAEAMRRLRESTALRQPGAGLPQAGPSRPRPPPPPPPAAPRPRPPMLPKQPAPPPASSNGSGSPATPGAQVDALPYYSGNHLEEKRPLIAGPTPDRAPPKPGPPPEKRFQCPRCDRAFARAYNLNTHLSTHDPDPQRSKPFPCPYPACVNEGRAFSRKHDLQRHIASTHESEPEPTVERVDENGEIISSTLVGAGIGAPGRKFRCECGRAFVRRDALRRHNCEAMRGSQMDMDSEEPDDLSGYRRRRGDDDDDDDDLAGLADIDAVAASFTESAAAEMRAAQEHAAARDQGSTPTPAPRPPPANKESTTGPSVVASNNKSQSQPSTSNPPKQTTVDPNSDEAIMDLASQLTADAAAQMDLGDEGANDEAPEPAPSASSKEDPPSAVQETSARENGEDTASQIDDSIDEQGINDVAADLMAEVTAQVGGSGDADEVNTEQESAENLNSDSLPHGVGESAAQAATEQRAEAGPVDRGVESSVATAQKQPNLDTQAGSLSADEQPKAANPSVKIKQEEGTNPAVGHNVPEVDELAQEASERAANGSHHDGNDAEDRAAAAS